MKTIKFEDIFGDADLDNVLSSGRAPLPASRPRAPTLPTIERPENFWWWWSAGTVLWPLAGIWIRSDHPGWLATLILLAGLAVGVINIWLALATDGYVAGRYAAIGQGIATVAGQVGVGLLVVAVILAILAFIVALVIVVAVLAGLAGVDD